MADKQGSDGGSMPATNISEYYREIAEGLFYDLKQPLMSAGLYALHQENAPKGSPLALWKQTFDMLVKEIGIRKDAVHGIVAPAGINPEGVAKLSTADIELLLPSRPGGYSGVSKSASSMTQLFLNDFYKKYGPPLQGIICEHAVHKAADKFTDFWAKYVERLIEIVKVEKYADYKYAVNRINELAMDPSFPGAISTGFAKGEHFHADKKKLEDCLQGWHPAAGDLSKLDATLSQMLSTASNSSHWGFERSLREMKESFDRDVKPVFDGYKAAVKELQYIRTLQTKVANGRTWL